MKLQKLFLLLFILSVIYCSSKKESNNLTPLLFQSESTKNSNKSQETYKIDPYVGFSPQLQNIMSYKIDKPSINQDISASLAANTWKRLNENGTKSIYLNLDTKITYALTDGNLEKEIGSYSLQKIKGEVFNPSLTAIMNVKAQEKFAVLVGAVYHKTTKMIKQNSLQQLIQEWDTLKPDINNNTKTVDDILNTNAIAKIVYGTANNLLKLLNDILDLKNELKEIGKEFLNIIKQTNKKAGKSTSTSFLNLKKGYHNSGFIYFYYPKDGKIYYLTKSGSGINIYKMNLDGTNLQKASDKIRNIYPQARYLYIQNDMLFVSPNYNANNELTAIKLNSNATGVERVVSGGKGMMKVFGDKLYFFKKDGNNYDLYSFPTNSNASETKEVDSCNCYISNNDGGDFYVRNNNIYYSDGINHKVKTGSTTNTILNLNLTAGSIGNVVFTKNSIYYRTSKNDYSIGKSIYDSYAHILVKDTIEQLNEKNALNVSDDWIVYYGRDGSNDTHGLYSLSKFGLNEKKLTTIESRNFNEYPKLRGEIKIIGEWAYYMLETSNKIYEIYRIKKDGSNKAKIKTIDLP